MDVKQVANVLQRAGIDAHVVCVAMHIAMDVMYAQAVGKPYDPSNAVVCYGTATCSEILACARKQNEHDSKYAPTAEVPSELRPVA